jgi:hypothetical protein
MSCNKVPFATKELALKEIRQIKFDKQKFSKKRKMSNRHKDREAMYAYYCHTCAAWNLTSKKPW